MKAAYSEGLQTVEGMSPRKTLPLPVSLGHNAGHSMIAATPR